MHKSTINTRLANLYNTSVLTLTCCTQVKETLGVGRHGEVKKCVHNASGCLVAVKIIPFAEGSASGKS